MSRRYRALIILATLIKVTVQILNPIVSSISRDPVFLNLIDAESRFAIGGKIDLKEADLFSLQLIPGVSDHLSKQILRFKKIILRKAQQSVKGEEWKALEVVKGIGTKGAAKLNRFLKLPSGTIIKSLKVEQTKTGKTVATCKKRSHSKRLK